MNPRRVLNVTRMAAILTLLIPMSSIPRAAFAQGRSLFQDAAVAGEPDESDEAVKRSRFVRVSFPALLGAAQAESQGRADAAVVELNLFPDASLRAVIDRVESASDHTSYLGHLDGDEGQVVLVVQGGVVAGSIRGGGKLYQVRFAGGDVHEVQEIDPGLLPPDGEPIAPAEQGESPGESSAAEADDVAVAADDGTQIDVLVAYTPAARAAAGGTAAMQALINLGITETNQAYANTGAIQRVRLVHTVELSYTETGNMGTDLDRLRISGDGFLDGVHALRNTYGADLVHLIVNSGGYCGIGYVMESVGSSFASWAFGVTKRTCVSPNLSFGHEMGHNMGLQHDRYVNTSNVPYPYSHGYVNQAAFASGASTTKRWRTIMAYNDRCSAAGFNCTRLMYFSNPSKTYTGDAMGVAGTSASSSINGPANARQSLDNTRVTVANFRATKVAPGIATLVYPTGNIIDTTPTFYWRPVPDATWYRMWLRKGSVDVTTHIKWYTSAQVGCSSGLGYCFVTPSPALTLGGYTWWIQAYSPAGYGSWSAGKSFNIVPSGFNSQFNGSISPWQVHSGSWSNVSSQWLYTAGLNGSSSSVSYPQNFSSLDYRVRVWRYGSNDGNPTRIIVRGNPSPLGSDNLWASGYMFQITRNGYYSVYKSLTSAVKGWTATTAINKGSAWNEMRVVAIGTSLRFYINGTLVWSGTDSSFSSGRVGIGMYRGAGTTGNGLYVDYAVLSVPADLDPEADSDRVSLEQLHANESEVLGFTANGARIESPGDGSEGADPRF